MKPGPLSETERKKLYFTVIREMHPDTGPEDQRNIRNIVTQQVNQAFKDGDDETLRRLHDALPPPNPTKVFDDGLVPGWPSRDPSGKTTQLRVPPPRPSTAEESRAAERLAAHVEQWKSEIAFPQGAIQTAYPTLNMTVLQRTSSDWPNLNQSMRRHRLRYYIWRDLNMGKD